jgi:hypothetical protein
MFKQTLLGSAHPMAQMGALVAPRRLMLGELAARRSVMVNTVQENMGGDFEFVAPQGRGFEGFQMDRDRLGSRFSEIIPGAAAIETSLVNAYHEQVDATQGQLVDAAGNIVAGVAQGILQTPEAQAAAATSATKAAVAATTAKVKAIANTIWANKTYLALAVGALAIGGYLILKKKK